MVKNWPDFFGDLSFQFQRTEWTGVDFPATSVDPWIKCVFLLQSVRVFSKNGDVHNFISKWRRPWPFLWGDLSFQFQCPQWTGVDFPATSFYTWIKCVFLLQSVRVFSKNADVHNFISKWRRPWPFLWWFILSISMPTMDRGRFSIHFLLSEDKMCFPSSVCESFLKKCWRAQF